MSDDSATTERRLNDWAIHVLERAHQSGAGGLGTEDLSMSDLVERESGIVASDDDCQFEQTEIQERAEEIVSHSEA